MRRPQLEISPGAAFLTALLAYLARPGEIPAVLLPVLAHELGHLAAMGALGLRLRSFRLGLDGPCIEYTGETDPAGHILTAAAGPLAGLAYAWMASALGQRLDCGWLCLSAGVSLLLSLFNLLPALPLDGGRILRQLVSSTLGEERGERLLQALGLALSVLLLLGGTALLIRQKGAALLLAGLWLLRESLPGLGLVKMGKI